MTATTAHHRAPTNEPRRIRNSPTKPFSPGKPIDESITTMKNPARIGAAFCSPLSLAISRV